MLNSTFFSICLKQKVDSYFTARLKCCEENTFTTMEITCASNSLSAHTPLPSTNADVWIYIGFLETMDMCKL